GTEASNVDVGDPTGSTNGVHAGAAGAHTHYAFDVVRGGEAQARVEVIDNSSGSLAASDANQNPTPRKGSQHARLKDGLCRAAAEAGSPAEIATGTSTVSAALRSIIQPEAAWASRAAREVAGLAEGLLTGMVPFVVASSSGDKFGPAGAASGTASQ